MKQTSLSSFKSDCNARQGGFTLMEIMLVVVIIALLLGTAVHFMGPNIEKARAVAVQADLSAISTALKTYNGFNGFYPTTEQGLKALVTQPTTEPRPRQWNQSFEKIPLDPWGKEYNYRCPGKHNPNGFDIYSSGPARTPDTEFLGNWDSAPANN